MKPIVLTTHEWKLIRDALKEEHPKTVFMIRNKMKEVLGFTVREHKAWVEKPRKEFENEMHEWEERQSIPSLKNDPFSLFDIEPMRGNTEYQIHLDFYSQNKRTMFLLKFSDIIGKRP
jgi:hypothetical protein